jgi:hypothetical protein
MAPCSRRSASCRHQSPHARRLRRRNRSRTSVDEPARLDLPAARPMPMLSTTAARRSSPRSPPSRCVITRSARSFRPRLASSPRCTGAKSMATSIRVTGAKVFMARCGSGCRRGRRYWTPTTSITACFCPFCCTVATIRGSRCSDHHKAAARLGMPAPIFHRPSRPSASTGCRSATRAPADHRKRGSSHRLLLRNS